MTQRADLPRQIHRMSSARAVSIAILLDAVAALLKGADSKRNSDRVVRMDVERWFAADDREWPFSFVNICGVLDLDPARIRRVLAETRARTVARR